MEKVKDIQSKKEINRAKELEKIYKISKQLLKKIGMKIHISGFKYWLEALLIVVENDIIGKYKLTMMEIYKYIAQKYNTTISRVEKCMRYSCAELDIKKQFNVNYPITNTALLFLLKEEILNQM